MIILYLLHQLSLLLDCEHAEARASAVWFAESSVPAQFTTTGTHTGLKHSPPSASPKPGGWAQQFFTTTQPTSSIFPQKLSPKELFFLPQHLYASFFSVTFSSSECKSQELRKLIICRSNEFTQFSLKLDPSHPDPLCNHYKKIKLKKQNF